MLLQIHGRVSIPPKYSVAQVVGCIVGNTVKWTGGGTERIDPSEYLMKSIWDAAQLGDM